MRNGADQPPPADEPAIVRDGIQVFPLLGRTEFETEDDYWDYLDEVNRFNNGLRSRARERDRPPRTTAKAGEYRQLGVKLALPDYELLDRLAEERRLRPTALARSLLVRALHAESRG